MSRWSLQVFNKENSKPEINSLSESRAYQLMSLPGDCVLVLDLNGYHAAGQRAVHFHWQARQGVKVSVPLQDDILLVKEA